LADGQYMLELVDKSQNKLTLRINRTHSVGIILPIAKPILHIKLVDEDKIMEYSVNWYDYWTLGPTSVLIFLLYILSDVFGIFLALTLLAVATLVVISDRRIILKQVNEALLKM